MRIKIDSGAVTDIASLGFYLVKSPSLIGFDIKESNIVETDFPEESGVSIYIPATPTYKPFDYSITLMYSSSSLNDANAKILSLYNSLVGKKITIYNDYKKSIIVGYVRSYKEGEFYRDLGDTITFELTFRVPKPQDCSLNA